MFSYYNGNYKIEQNGHGENDNDSWICRVLNEPVSRMAIKTSPLWWEDILPATLADNDLPERVDVAVIGGGFAV